MVLFTALAFFFFISPSSENLMFPLSDIHCNKSQTLRNRIWFQTYLWTKIQASVICLHHICFTTVN